MKLRAFAPALIGLCLCWASTAYPQMTPHYDMYTSQSYDGTKIYTSVLTDGYTSGCCIPPTVQHTPSSYNVIGAVGGWGYGNPDCWTCNISYENDQSIAASSGTEYEFDAEGEVDCSLAGLFYDSGLSSVWLSIHNTTYKYSSVSGGICIYSAYCLNTQQICGGNSINVAAPCPYEYTIGVFLKARIGSYSTCYTMFGISTNTWAACF